MRRRDLIIASAAAIIARRADAQAPTKLARVGVVSFGAPTSEIISGLHQALPDKGYVVGRNLVLEERFAEGHADRLAAEVAELLTAHVDVIVAVGTQAARAAKRATATVPIVFTSGDPVGAGLVASLSRPGGNLTGISLLSGEYSRKWLALLKEAVPALHRVAVLWNPDNPVIAMEVEQMRPAAAGLSLELAAFPARAKDFDAALAAIGDAGANGLVITDDAFLDSLAPRLSTFATEHRLPAIAGVGDFVRAGLLMSYSVDFIAIALRVVDYIDRIFKGVHPAELPVEQATKFTLWLNLKTAKAFGLEISANLLARADEVIE